MRAALAIVAALAAPAAAEPAVELDVTVHQEALLLTSPATTTGGIGGGLGVQLTYADRYLAQLDVGTLWMIGSPIATRFAVGAQRHGAWAPALWLAGTAIWGDRVEIVMAPGDRPAMPAWGVGVRASPLRFRSAWGTVSALEPGLATDLRGTLLELTVLQAGAHW